MRRYVCPSCRGRCVSCGHRPPVSSKMTASGADGYLLLIVLCCLAIGGIGKLVILLSHTLAGKIFGITLGSAVLLIILAVIAGSTGIK